MPSQKKWYANGIHFQCQGSGKCCLSRGEYGYVYLTPKDLSRFAKFFKITIREFKKQYCEQTEGVWHLKEDNADNGACMFLQNNSCTAYEGRPSQCRTWPFWPENMNAKTWKTEIATFCPGVGKGPLITEPEITKFLDEAEQADLDLLT